jgi:hypothetical protein
MRQVKPMKRPRLADRPRFSNKPPPQNFPAIEGSESKPQHSNGRLSEGTLKALLQAQELN